MGQAKRKQQAMTNGNFWTFATADDHVVKNLSLDKALNLLGYYTVEQAKQVVPKMVIWDISQMKINDRVYESVKKHCLRTGFLSNARFDCIEYSPKTWKQISYWEKKKLSAKKRRLRHL